MYNSGFEIVQRVKAYVHDSLAIISNWRNKFIGKRLNKVYLKHTGEADDIIDDLINDPNKQETKDQTNTNLYSYLEHFHPANPPKVSIGEPSLCSPCSYENVNEVLYDLLLNTNVGNERKWAAIGCDGLPYTLASRLMKKDPDLQNNLLQPGIMRPT